MELSAGDGGVGESLGNAGAGPPVRSQLNRYATSQIGASSRCHFYWAAERRLMRMAA